jgi:hypothetical protein
MPRSYHSHGIESIQADLVQILQDQSQRVEPKFRQFEWYAINTGLERKKGVKKLNQIEKKRTEPAKILSRCLREKIKINNIV